jgi:hypothetical protein
VAEGEPEVDLVVVPPDLSAADAVTVPPEEPAATEQE